MADYNRILKECFWDYDLNKNDLKQIVLIGNQREQRKLFSKIIYNSKDKIKALEIFPKEQLRIFLHDFKPTYNERYINRHLLVLKSLLLGEKHKIRGLEWKKR